MLLCKWGNSHRRVFNQSNQRTNPRASVVWKPISVGAGIAAAISAGLMYLETQQEIDFTQALAAQW